LRTERSIVHINELINPESLRHDIDNGFIRENHHPSLPLRILNYTEKAQFSRHWNKATLACRGLIVHDDGRVIARPFPKFFNWEEQKPKGRQFQMSLDELVTVTDKMDGSLGILYPNGEGTHSVATRGSFTSDQAIHATKIWKDRYQDEFAYRMNPRLTYLFEIIYPSNRIVVDYKGLDDLVLIGAVDIPGGFVYGPEIAPGWPGPSAAVFPYKTLREAVSARPRPGMEGLVVRSLSDGLMVKLKQEDYVALHRIVTGLNEKEIWRRCMKADLELPPEVTRRDHVIRDIPDELHEWVTDVAMRLFTQVYTKKHRVNMEYLNRLPSSAAFPRPDERQTRKDFANNVKSLEPWLRTAMWLMYDHIDVMEFLWKTVEPRGDVKK
jgi:RNA ligase